MKEEIKLKLRALSHRSRIFSVVYRKASELKDRRYSVMSDEEYVKMLYQKKTGHALDLDNPEGFNAKLQWLKLYNHNPIYTTMVDKVLVKDYVAERIGAEHVIPTLKVWDKPSQIDFYQLPDQFVLKCNHNSGAGMTICVDKSKLNLAQTRRNLQAGLKNNSYLAGREWPYKNVQKKVFAETFMKDDSTGALVDYKFYCFNGEPRFLYVGLANYHDGKKNDELTYLTLDWKTAPFYRTDHKPFPYEIEKPAKYEQMLEISSELSHGIPFVRVDLYHINGKVYFSEFTFFPGGGFNEFKPYDWERKIGSWVDLSLVK